MSRPPRTRRGLTLIELLLAISIMAVLAGVLGALAQAVLVSAEYSQGHGLAAQHARVAFDRVGRAVEAAYAVGDYPGVAVVWEDVAGSRFPDTLVVWRPKGAPANPTGPPLVQELVIYCPNPDQPNVLLEITVPGDTRPVSLDNQLSTSGWLAELKALKTSSSSRRVVLTNLLRTASPTTGVISTWGANNTRGCVRFVLDLRPSAVELADCQAGKIAWDQLVWPQGLCGANSGLRHVWVRAELQLMPGTTVAAADPGGQQAIPFLGSATLEYLVQP